MGAGSGSEKAGRSKGLLEKVVSELDPEGLGDEQVVTGRKDVLRWGNGQRLGGWYGVSAPQVWLGCQMSWASNGEGGLWSDAGEPKFPAAEVGLPSWGRTVTAPVCQALFEAQDIPTKPALGTLATLLGDRQDHDTWGALKESEGRS